MVALPDPRPCGDFRTSYRDDQALFHTRFDRYAVLVAILVVALTPLWADRFVLSQLILIGIYGIAALGLNVLVGYTGQISLGHSAFFGFGAFASAWIASKGVPALLAIPLAGLMTTAVGMIFGLPAARLKGRAEWFTGGSSGSPAETVTLFGFAFNSDETYIYVVLFWVVVSFLAVSNLIRSRDGRALIAVRDHYLSAEIMGINLTKYRVMSFGISSFFAGIGGALYAHYLGFVSGEAFTILLSIQFLAMIIIGGLGSIAGSLVGAAFILLLPQVMEVLAANAAGIFPALTQGVPYLKQMAVGAAIILFLVLEPEGLMHRWRLIRASWKLYPFSH
jgi:branched-chain amino acid transport system permease protein